MNSIIRGNLSSIAVGSFAADYEWVMDNDGIIKKVPVTKVQNPAPKLEDDWFADLDLSRLDTDNTGVHTSRRRRQTKSNDFDWDEFERSINMKKPNRTRREKVLKAAKRRRKKKIWDTIKNILKIIGYIYLSNIILGTVISLIMLFAEQF